MASCFGKYGINTLENYNFTSSEYTSKKKNNYIYCTIRNDLDNNNNYKDNNYEVIDGKLKFVKSNLDHIQLTKAQYYYYYSQDCSCTFDIYNIELLDNCYYIPDNNDDISNNYAGTEEPLIDGSANYYASIISDSSFDYDTVDISLRNKLPIMDFPTIVRFDNKFC